MQFTVSSSTLLKQLSTIQGVIVANPVVPILENFLLEIANNKLTIIASDLQITMRTELAVEVKDNIAIAVAVPARILLDTLKNLPAQPITFSIDEETYSIEMNSNNGRYKLAGENATDFPKMPEVTNEFVINISSEILKKAISQTIIAVSNDELRPALNGMYIKMGAAGITFVATDSHRLVRYISNEIIREDIQACVIPRKSLMLLNGLLPNNTTQVNIAFNETNAYVELDNLKMIARLIDEKYPDYENVIPQDNPNKLMINRIEFLNSLKRIAIYANRTTHQVKLKITGNTLQIFAEDFDFSNEANESLTCEYQGADMEIGFNAKFLIEMLNSMQQAEITMHLSEPSKACIILPKENEKKEDLLLLIMPIVLN